MRRKRMKTRVTRCIYLSILQCSFNIVQMFINHFLVENIDNQRIKYYKEGNQYGLHANGHQMIFHHPIIEDIERIIQMEMPITSYLVHWRKVVIRRLTSATLISSICVFLFQRYVFQSHHMPARMLMAMNPKREQSFLVVVR